MGLFFRSSAAAQRLPKFAGTEPKGCSSCQRPCIIDAPTAKAIESLPRDFVEFVDKNMRTAIVEIAIMVKEAQHTAAVERIIALVGIIQEVARKAREVGISIRDTKSLVDNMLSMHADEEGKKFIKTKI